MPAFDPAVRANWSYPTSIWFGAGRIAELATACRDAGIARPLFVTDRETATLPIARLALDTLGSAGLLAGVFADVDANPRAENLAAGLPVFRDGDHDGVVAFGGGSGLDVGKLIAPIRRPSPRSLRCRPPPEPAARSGARRC